MNCLLDIMGCKLSECTKSSIGRINIHLEYVKRVPLGEETYIWSVRKEYHWEKKHTFGVCEKSTIGRVKKRQRRDSNTRGKIPLT